MKRILVLLLFCIIATVGAAELANYQFSIDDQAIKQWDVKMLGDGNCQLVEYERTDNQPNSLVVLKSTTPRSWGGLIKNIPAEELKGAKTVYLTCDFMTNAPAYAEVALAEDADWGGVCPHCVVQRGTKAYQWERITIKIDRKKEDSYISFGISKSYCDSDGWLAIDKIVITLDEEPVLPPLPTYSVQLPKNKDFIIPFLNSVHKINLLNAPDSIADAASVQMAVNALRDEKDGIASEDLGKAFETINRYNNITLTVKPVANTYMYNQNTPVENDMSVQTMNLPQNAKDSLLYLVRNNSESSQTLNLSVSGDVAKYAKIYQLLEIQEAPNYPKEVISGDMIQLGSGETTGILVELSTKSASAGIHDGSLNIVTRNSKVANITISFKLNVGSYRLADELPIKSFHWDYNVAAQQEEKLKAMVEDRINTYHVSMRGGIDSVDMSMLERVPAGIKKIAPDMEFYIIVEVWFPREAGVWTQEYNEWLDKVADILEKNGVPKSHWYLEIYDEILSPEFAEAAREIKKHDPELQIFSDFMPKEQNERDDFIDYLDIWCPLASEIAPVCNEYQYIIDFIDAHRAENENIELWAYRCDPNTYKDNNIFRQMGLQALVNNLDGLGYWTVYDIKTREPANSQWNWGFFYKSPAGKVVRARHWMQYAAGLEDYMLFSAALEQGGEVADIAKKAIDELSKASYENNDNLANIINKYRGLIINKM